MPSVLVVGASSGIGREIAVLFARDGATLSASLPPALNVGLRWAGSPTFKLDELRSPRQLSLMAPLSSAKGVRFISLQKGDGADQAKKPPVGMELHDWTEELHDFADTAALVSQLDLVIYSDTAVAHLAGAMNKPVWLLLPFIPDWRWLLGREDSPWYPSMRLFRQSSPGDWGSAIGRAADELRRWVRDRGSHST